MEKNFCAGPWAPDLAGLLARDPTDPLIWCLISENHYSTIFSMLFLGKRISSLALYIQLYISSSMALALWIQLYCPSSMALALQLQLYSPNSIAPAQQLQFYNSSIIASALQLQLYSSSSIDPALQLHSQLYSFSSYIFCSFLLSFSMTELTFSSDGISESLFEESRTN